MAEELWKSIVRVAAPALGAAVVGTVTGGVGAPVGGMIASMLAEEVLGPDEAGGAKPASQRLSEAFSSPTPQMIADLQKAALNVQVQLKKLDIDLERIAADDRDSARRREVETKDWVPKALSIIIVVGFFANISLQYFGMTVDAAAFQALYAALMLVLGYYFGSSSGSAAKNATIDGLTKFYPTSADSKPKQEFF